MAPARSSSNRRRSSRRRGRSRIFLFVLLVVIAGLLAVIVTQLPDVMPESDLAAQPDRVPPAETVEAEPGSGSPDRPDGQGATPEVADEPVIESTEPVTEYYPEEEPVRVPSETPGEGDLWWLPAPETAGRPAGTLFLILDDAGNNIGPLSAFLEFPGPLAVAVLPQLEYSVEASARTAAAGKEIMLHLPMEATGGENPGPGALTVGMSDGEILRVIDENLGSVPGAVGVNNHMGSRATSDRPLMQTVLADLNRRDLFFVDSRTSVDSVAEPVAEVVGIPFAARHVFLDNDRSRDAILQALSGALELSWEQDAVVMIGHATVPELAAVLNEIYPILIENGYRFGLVSDLVRVPGPAPAAPSVSAR